MAKAEIPLKYDANRIIGVHGLERGLECDYLDKILTATTVIEPEFEQYLENHRQALRLRGEYWNEEELKMNFLAHIFYVAQLREDKKIDIFYERALSWEFGGKTERVICDCLLAKPFGVYAPQTPYFFLQAAPPLPSPKERENNGAEGQMLLAMLMVQAENANGKPIYGCYLQGKNWVFTTVHDKNYCVSRQYDATQSADLQQIIAILRQLKKVILTELL